MNTYLDLLQTVASRGYEKDTVTSPTIKSIFGYQMCFSLREGFPLVTTRTIKFSDVVVELLWSISGSTNIRQLQDKGVGTWDHLCDKDGNVGFVHGKQWRQWGHEEKDQLDVLIKNIRSSPDSRELVLSSWNVSDIQQAHAVGNKNKPKQSPCTISFQFYVNVGRLSCHVYQRSSDVYNKLPASLASHALLTQMIAQQCDLKTGNLIWSVGDAFIPIKDLKNARKQIQLQPYPDPYINLTHAPSISEYTVDDIELYGYRSHHRESLF